MNYTKKQKYWVEEAAGKANPVTPSLINSIFVTLGSTLLTLILSIPASYALSRYNFKGNKDIAFFIEYKNGSSNCDDNSFLFIFNYINLVDTLLGLILMSVMINAQFVYGYSKVFLMVFLKWNKL